MPAFPRWQHPCRPQRSVTVRPWLLIPARRRTCRCPLTLPSHRYTHDPSPPAPYRPETPELFSVSTVLAFQECSLNTVVPWVTLGLASVAQRPSLEIRPGCRGGGRAGAVWCRAVFPDALATACLSGPPQGRLGCPRLGLRPVKLFGTVASRSLCECELSLLCSRVPLLGRTVVASLEFLRSCPTSAPRGCVTLHSHRPCA